MPEKIEVLQLPMIIYQLISIYKFMFSLIQYSIFYMYLLKSIDAWNSVYQQGSSGALRIFVCLGKAHGDERPKFKGIFSVERVSSHEVRSYVLLVYFAFIQNILINPKVNVFIEVYAFGMREVTSAKLLDHREEGVTPPQIMGNMVSSLD